MRTPHIAWDWQPAVFRPPFTVIDVEHGYKVTADAKYFRWTVAHILGGTPEEAERLLDLVRIRYEMEVRE
jgi:hypothetical protein